MVGELSTIIRQQLLLDVNVVADMLELLPRQPIVIRIVQHLTPTPHNSGDGVGGA